MEQAAIRNNALECLTNLYGALPNPTSDLSVIFETGEIDEDRITESYTALTELFASDPCNDRLALYFPFELIPNLEKDLNIREDTKIALEKFVTAYKASWNSLLSYSEIRADFADGDIVEIKHRTESLPQVAKAAHLIPKLVAQNVIQIDEVISILKETTDTVLQNSIADALSVLMDENLLSDEDLVRLEESQSFFVQNTARILKTYADRTHTTEDESMLGDEKVFFAKIENEIANIEDHIRANKQMTQSRQTWLLEKEIGNTIDKYSVQLVELASSFDQDATPFALWATAPDTSDISRRVVVRALCSALESEAKTNLAKAQQAFTKHTQMFEELLRAGNGDIQNEVTRALYHLRSLNVIDDRELESFGLEKPLLDAPTSEILESMRDTITEFTEASLHIKEHPELSKLIYPIIVFLGSRMKGYSRSTSDLDVAVFVRPGVQEEERRKLQTYLGEVLTETKSDGRAMEFWLTEENDTLSIRDYENPDPQRGDSTLTHPLIGAWCGDTEAIAELYAKLMPGYVFTGDKKILGEDARALWLKGMEHDILQYRLMHKGYSNFKAAQGGIHGTHAHEIDGTSTFFDSGYRRLATKLFIERVFLPDLPK